MPGVLIVIKQMIKRSMAVAGLDISEVYEASNGIEAFAQLAEHEVALVVLDINMPVMNGIQFLTRMRDDPRLCDVPVVIASTQGSETRIEQLMVAGARGYLRKPFYPERARDTLAPMLGVCEAGVATLDREDDACF